jgi:membrane-associated phospholipid phosphatase
MTVPYDAWFVIDGSPVARRRSADAVLVRRSLWCIVGAASVLATAVYGIAVRTVWGQRLDTAALRGRHLLSTRNIQAAQRLHTTIDIASIALFGGAILLVALVRGRRRLAVGVAFLIVGSLATSELLKRILGRPRLAVADSLKHAPTFPSGHTTIAMALAVGAIFVAPRRFRGSVAALGVVFAGAIGCSMVITASHRPSDTIGALLIVTAWSAAVAAIIVRSQPLRVTTRPMWTHISPWMAVAGAALLTGAFLSAVIVALAIHHGSLNTVELGRAFVGAASAIFGTTIMCTAALLIALHDVDLDKPGRPRSQPQQAQHGATAHA